ncbi:hypothetical protein C0081_03435 [Cohaesibacter celericrescens]|uniref:Integrase catalytic domain-containing protein n=1 Tax=Cohaesibacter celericrescens TaxID=2067669 RepID=A0A2N5XW41_9HYPH|nr:hypothetical protein C0081_03435 [Cohaesibacter celericrescens]
MAIFEYINGFQNSRRRHSTLGWKSPLAFEKMLPKRALGAARNRDRFKWKKHCCRTPFTRRR